MGEKMEFVTISHWDLAEVTDEMMEEAKLLWRTSLQKLVM